jgi:uncharacterized membrane protein
MQKIFLNVVLLKIVFDVITLFLLPEKVASHFGAGGRPDAFTTKEGYVLVFLVMEIPMAVFYYYLPFLIMKMPKRWVNLPHREYWLDDKFKKRTHEKVATLVYECGTAFFVFLFICSGLSVWANLSDPIRLNEPVFMISFITFMIYIVYWCIKFFKVFRIPHDVENI